jgi:hypothetical protein
MAKYHDPILEYDPSKDSTALNTDSEGDVSGSGEEDSSEEELDFPRESATDLENYLHRDITNVSNMEDAQKRKFALLKLYQVLVLSKKKPTTAVY